jgi:DinB family protein
MTSLTIPRPASDEAAPSFQGYIREVASEDIGSQLSTQLDAVKRLLAPLNDNAAAFRYAEGKWSIKEVLGHLNDVERIFSYRLLRIARGDPTPLPGFDENAYVPPARFDQRPLGTLLAEFRTVRASTRALVEGLPSESWSRRGETNGKPVSARALAYIIVGHVAHHLSVLQERYGLGQGSGTTG